MVAMDLHDATLTPDLALAQATQGQTKARG
jgi:hypothetical protein